MTKPETTTETRHIYKGRDVNDLIPNELRNALKDCIETNFSLRQTILGLSKVTLFEFKDKS